MWFKKIIYFVCISVSISSCTDDDITPVCDGGNIDFVSLYASVIQSGAADKNFLDTEIHEYTFVLSQTKNVCKIGYQSHADIASTPYQIEIVDSSATVVYSGSHIFSSSEASYVSPNSTVTLHANMPYTIRRIQTNWGNYITNTIGRVAISPTMNFPYTFGIMTITGSNFYQNGGPSVNAAVPCIALIFI